MKPRQKCKKKIEIPGIKVEIIGHFWTPKRTTNKIIKNIFENLFTIFIFNIKLYPISIYPIISKKKTLAEYTIDVKASKRVTALKADIFW